MLFAQYLRKRERESFMVEQVFKEERKKKKASQLGTLYATSSSAYLPMEQVHSLIEKIMLRAEKQSKST